MVDLNYFSSNLSSVQSKEKEFINLIKYHFCDDDESIRNPVMHETKLNYKEYYFGASLATSTTNYFKNEVSDNIGVESNKRKKASEVFSSTNTNDGSMIINNNKNTEIVDDELNAIYKNNVDNIDNKPVEFNNSKKEVTFNNQNILNRESKIKKVSCGALFQSKFDKTIVKTKLAIIKKIVNQDFKCSYDSASSFYTFLTFHRNKNYLKPNGIKYSDSKYQYKNPTSPFDIDTDKFELRIYFIKESEENLNLIKNNPECLSQLQEFKYDFSSNSDYPEMFYFRLHRQTTLIHHGNSVKLAKKCDYITDYTQEIKEMKKELEKGIYLEIELRYSSLEILSINDTKFHTCIMLFNTDKKDWNPELYKYKSPLIHFFGIFKFFIYFSRYSLTNYINNYLLDIMFKFTNLSTEFIDFFRKFGMLLDEKEGTEASSDVGLETVDLHDDLKNKNNISSNLKNAKYNSNNDNNNNNIGSIYSKRSKFTNKTNKTDKTNDNNDEKSKYIIFPLKSTTEKALNLIDSNFLNYLKSKLSELKKFYSYEEISGYFELFTPMLSHYTPQLFSKRALRLDFYNQYFVNNEIIFNNNSELKRKTMDKNSNKNNKDDNKNNKDEESQHGNSEYSFKASSFNSNFENYFSVKSNSTVNTFDENLWFNHLFKYITQHFALVTANGSNSELKENLNFNKKNNIMYNSDNFLQKCIVKDWKDLKDTYLNYKDFIKDSLVKCILKQITYKGFINVDVISNEDRMLRQNFCCGNRKKNNKVNKFLERIVDSVLSGINSFFNLNEGFFHKHFTMLGFSYNFNKSNTVITINTDVDASLKNKIRLFDVVFMPNWAHDLAEIIMLIWTHKFQMLTDFTFEKESEFNNLSLSNIIGNSFDLITDEFFNIYSECLPDFANYCYSASDFVKEEYNCIDNACQHFTNKCLNILLKNNMIQSTVLHWMYNESVEKEIIPQLDNLYDPYMVHVDKKYVEYLKYSSNKQGLIDIKVDEFIQKSNNIDNLKRLKKQLMVEEGLIEGSVSSEGKVGFDRAGKAFFKNSKGKKRTNSKRKSKSRITDKSDQGFVIIDPELKKEINEMSCLNDKKNPSTNKELAMILHELQNSNNSKVYWNVVKVEDCRSYRNNAYMDVFHFSCYDEKENTNTNTNESIVNNFVNNNIAKKGDHYLMIEEENQKNNDTNNYFPIVYLLNLNCFYQHKLQNRLLISIIEYLLTENANDNDSINSKTLDDDAQDRDFFELKLNNKTPQEYDSSAVKNLSTSRLLISKSKNMCYIYYDYIVKSLFFISDLVSQKITEKEKRKTETIEIRDSKQIKIDVNTIQDNNIFDNPIEKEVTDNHNEKILENNIYSSDENNYENNNENNDNVRTSLHSNRIANPNFEVNYAIKENCYVRIGWLTANLKYFNKTGIDSCYRNMFE